MSETPTSPVVGGPSENAFAEPSIEQMKAEQNLYNDTDTHGGRMDISRFQDNGINKAALIFDIVNQMKSGKDLYRISLPTAFICPQSMNEYILQFIIPNEYLEGINEVCFFLFLFFRKKNHKLKNQIMSDSRSIGKNDPCYKMVDV